ncbi:MAG: prohibitin family protein [Candidatus Micrarchaeia archaeon]
MVFERAVFGVFGLVFLIIIAVLIGLLFFTVVPAGHVGVRDELGVVSDDPIKPGLIFKVPWQDIVPMTVMTQQLEETAETPTAEGLTVDLDTSILYHIEPDAAPSIYKSIGLDYETVVVVPTFRSAIRDISSKYDAKALYTSERGALADQIYNDIKGPLKDRGIVVEKVLLRAVRLPDRVKTGIEQKLVAEQDSQRMEFVLDKEKKEAQRKVIEAGGIADSQKIIAESLSPEFLQWYWINGLKDQRSVIYVPIGNNGLPLFKDVDKVPGNTSS